VAPEEICGSVCDITQTRRDKAVEYGLQAGVDSSQAGKSLNVEIQHMEWINEKRNKRNEET
jgi:hypothetical protein